MLRKNFTAVAVGLLALGYFTSANAALVRTIRYGNTVTAAGPNYLEIKAWCDVNEIATGGGFRSAAGSNVRIDENFPIFSETVQGWTIRFKATIPQFVGSTYVVCLREVE